jgi:hypothetical protein
MNRGIYTSSLIIIKKTGHINLGCFNRPRMNLAAKVINKIKSVDGDKKS